LIKTFRCYSSKMKDYFKQSGEDWIVIALDVVAPHNKYWLFERSPKFEELLAKWNSDQK
jgi:hypothetical protein